MDVTSSMNLFQKIGFVLLCLSSSFFYFGHKNVSESYSHFRSHGCSMSLDVIFSIEFGTSFLVE